MDSLDKLLKEKNDVESIVKSTCFINNITPQEFVVKSRERYLIDSRRMAYAATRDILGFGWSRIGREFKMDHANIIHHYKQHSNLLILDRFYSEKYEALLEVSKAEIGIIDVKDILLEVRRRKLEFSKEKIRIKEHLDNL